MRKNANLLWLPQSFLRLTKVGFSFGVERLADNKVREDRLSSLLSQEQVARFEEWQSEQRAKRFAALCDPRNAPSTLQLVDAVKRIDFAIDSTFADFHMVAFQYSNTPSIPLIRTPLHDFSVHLGGSIGSPSLIESFSDLDIDEFEYSALSHEYAERFIPDPMYDPLHRMYDPRHRMHGPLYPIYDTPHLLSSPIEYGFCIGKIMGQTLGDKSAPPQDTNFVLILSARDKSLWMVHNYYPLYDDGRPVWWQPVEMSGLVQLMKISPDGLFDCLQLLDSVSRWDPNKPLAGIPITSPPPQIRLLVAAPAGRGQLEKFVSTRSVSSS
jgi:hypothetical protein